MPEPKHEHEPEPEPEHEPEPEPDTAPAPAGALVGPGQLASEGAGRLRRVPQLVGSAVLALPQLAALASWG